MSFSPRDGWALLADEYALQLVELQRCDASGTGAGARSARLEQVRRHLAEVEAWIGILDDADSPIVTSSPTT